MKKEKISEYRGRIPLMLSGENGKVIYVCSSNRNIDDYYNTLIDDHIGKVIKIDAFFEKDEKDKINYELLDTLKKEKKYIILLSLEGFLVDYYNAGEKEIFEVDRDKDIKDIKKKLDENNYEKVYMIEKRKQYSIRGDILDIFPINGEDPVRIELFDNVVERINYFDINTQKSIKKIDKLEMYINNNKEEPISFLDLLMSDKHDDKKIYFENPELLSYKVEELILRDRETEKRIRDRYSILYQIGQEIETLKFSDEEIEKFGNIDELTRMSKTNDITICTNEEKRYTELLQNTNIKIIKGQYFEGYKITEKKKTKIFITDRELKGITSPRRTEKKTAIKYKDVSQIKEGDYIIHTNFGVGIYLGIQIIDGRDYLKIKYADEDKLFVPVENLKAIEKYVCNPGEVPEIYNLGRKGFRKKKIKLQEEMIKFAHEIIEVQARRDKGNGFIFSPDTVWQEEFEEGFPYRETPSQMKAIDDVKKDMETGKIMDRVICGDVGYGKTEVALRASFKATADGKQVAILVPTTILAQQHYERFTERFKNYPIEIQCISRLNGNKEQKDILNKIRKGSVDILIGTHRLLSNDIKFKDLGLVVVDEEQKFGVKAKEKLKKMKDQVDFLTLTATPIPRTLNLSLLGIRDLSIIDTPPEGRKPIETKFIERDNDKIKDAIMYEISREGQVFYIYNYVKGMERKVNEIKELLPQYIKVDYVHGQMVPSKIKEKINAFEDGETDVLFATTIIENGMDIENANTMIIEGVEKLGLSQIYQLRGRIGRGTRKSYCYLLISDTQNKKTKQREETIKELKTTGGGFQLSLEDMRIRGVGEILGEKQHGALETFGYNMYIKMLKEEIEKIKGTLPEKEEEVMIKVDNYGCIPDYYIDKDEKIVLYKRMVEISDEDELTDLYYEIKDRFGKIPPEVDELFNYLKIKIKAIKNNITEIEELDDGYLIKFNEKKLNDIKRERLIWMVSNKLAILKRNNKDIIYRKDILSFFEEMEKLPKECLGG